LKNVPQFVKDPTWQVAQALAGVHAVGKTCPRLRHGCLRSSGGPDVDSRRSTRQRQGLSSSARSQQRVFPWIYEGPDIRPPPLLQRPNLRWPPAEKDLSRIGTWNAVRSHWMRIVHLWQKDRALGFRSSAPL